MQPFSIYRVFPPKLDGRLPRGSNGAMPPSPHVSVHIDLVRVRNNAEAIAARTATPIIAVVKADAYGLGAQRVARAIAEVVAGFYVFDLAEAVEYRLEELTGKRTLALLGASDDPKEYIAHRVQPAVWSVERAAQLRKARPVLSVDTGQQRFACPAEEVAAVLRAADIDEAFTHASTLAQVERFKQIMQAHDTRGFRLHAAGSSLLNEPPAWLNAVRPGLALYGGAVRVSAPLMEVRDGSGPAGYSGFTVRRHGVIRAGYSNGLRAGPCLVNGRRSRIIEVGMQTSFVEASPDDRPGDEVVLLGDGLSESDVAQAWHAGPHEVLVRMCALGRREYSPEKI